MRWSKGLITGVFLLLISACSDEDVEENEAADSAEDLNEAYGDDVGLTVETPENLSFATEGTFTFEGNIEAHETLNDDYLWVILDTEDDDETETGNESFEYFVPIDENGSFSEEIALHSGDYNHHVSVRVPSNDSGEENTFYEGLNLDVHNASEEVQREIEYTLLGHEYGLQIEQPAQSYIEEENAVPLAGTLTEASDDQLVMVQVEKDGEESQFTTPVENGEFNIDVPLSFGEGVHTINVMVYAEDEDFYYDAAYLLADASSDEELVQVEAYEEYYDYGIEQKVSAAFPFKIFDLVGVRR
ncbi:hypothetical protein HUG15_05855 [Salicibibacter cibarius]|uniref:Uncharacterized protein n=1 Tax=Salicibibacter cibarius TaxID=2743000 RepID=A0A7T6Z1C0_9BACI|nr:hypothetical protein [Salicibibacter cibarius]QQK75178.1 hypothetical protein HUG15_05855 [Salicibibacter cibarius]